MQVEFTVSRAEQRLMQRSISLSLWQQPEHQSKKHSLAGLATLLVLIIGTLAVIAINNGGDNYYALAVIAATVAGYEAYRYYQQHLLNSMWLESGPRLGLMRFSADKTGVTLMTKYTTIHYGQVFNA